MLVRQDVIQLEQIHDAKSARMLIIYSRLVNGETLNKAHLAQEFHVTVRSIQRDLESLRCFFAEQMMNQDILYDPKAKGYSVAFGSSFITFGS